MARKFMSLIIAASIAVTGLSAAPAQASDRDLARALAAIAGVAIIGAVIHDNNKSKRRVIQHHQPRQKFYGHAPRARAYDRPHRAERRSYRKGFRNGYGQRHYSARPHRRGH